MNKDVAHNNFKDKVYNQVSFNIAIKAPFTFSFQIKIIFYVKIVQG